MDTRPCSFCSHENPEDAKFCNACGSSMHLQLCQRCGAIDNVSAVVCYKCGAPFSGHDADENSPSETAPVAARDAGDSGAAASVRGTATSPSADDTAPLGSKTKRRSGAAGVLLFVVIAAVAVFLYRIYAPSEEGGAGDAVQARSSSRSSPGTIDATLGAVPPSSAILAAEVVPVGTQQPVPAASQPIASDDPPLPVGEPATGAAPDASSADGAASPPAPRDCTPEVDALGLCN